MDCIGAAGSPVANDDDDDDDAILGDRIPDCVKGGADCVVCELPDVGGDGDAILGDRNPDCVKGGAPTASSASFRTSVAAAAATATRFWTTGIRTAPRGTPTTACTGSRTVTTTTATTTTVTTATIGGGDGGGGEVLALEERPWATRRRGSKDQNVNSSKWKIDSGY